MEGEASKAQSEPPPAYSQPQNGPPSQYSQPPVTMQPPPWAYPLPPMQQQQQQQQTSVVVVNQAAAAPTYKLPRPWTTGLFACFDDIGICCCVTFCPSCAESQLTSDMGESCFVPCCVPGWLVVLRMKLRTQHNIHGSVMDDCCTIYGCYRCVLCQMMREVKLTRVMGTVAQ